ncbi:LOW QUALITY PROTEIN: uncharacterized protein LOC133917882 [Phragmites australis]|uniref:LOW QUALITY PROTEIN: uncharacterized protein LOC133917882 n=1 Tax=Phragmites australis TaxID=29695 RepID=UPI002D79F000|nr:LOW QUALITY PROTEIN: uncharacterized protein LOC133917882 [Phragmites australis]
MATKIGPQRTRILYSTTDDPDPTSGISAVKLPKEHDEPWDYTCTNYPVILPLRRPYSGDPDFLDEEECGQSSSSRAQDGKLTAAEELGLMERVHKPQLLFFQFPASLPLPRQGDPVAETETDTNVDVNAKSKGNNRKRRHHSIHGCNMKELPCGLMGKILVHKRKSGKVKMTLGDALFDVSAGPNCSFAQEVVAIDSREKHCCSLGEVGNRAIVTPDIDSLLYSIEKME